MIVYAYLKDGAVYRDRDSYEEGDRLGTYSTVLDDDGRYAETSLIGGRQYRSLWLWSEQAEDTKKDHGMVPLIAID